MIQNMTGFGEPLAYRGRIFLPLVSFLQDCTADGVVVAATPLALLVVEGDQVWGITLHEGITPPDISRMLTEAGSFLP